MRFQHYIWDFDGTLFDSYPHIIRCFEMAMAEEGLKCERETLARQFYDCFRAAREYVGLSDAGYRRFKDLYLRLGEAEILPRAVPFHEIEGILRRITELGGDHYLYTNRNNSAIAYCEQYGLARYFKGYITAEDNAFAWKPHPDALLALMERESLSPADCVMIGDREIDGLSGVNAGMAGCLVTDMVRDKNGDDPLSVSAMPYKCRHLSDLYTLFDLR